MTESRKPFTFKLDYIKRLDSTTHNLSWRNQVCIYLHVMNIYKYVDGSTTRPTDTTQLDIRTRNDYAAKAAITSLLSEEFMYLANNVPTAKDACKAVEDHRDLRNSSTLHHTVQSFFSTTMHDTDVLTAHISAYEQKHTYTTEQGTSANAQSSQGPLLSYLKSDESNAGHLLMSHASSIFNIVDHRRSKDSVTYIDVRSCVLDLASYSNLCLNGPALNGRSYKINKFYNKKQNFDKPNQT